MRKEILLTFASTVLTLGVLEVGIRSYQTLSDDLPFFKMPRVVERAPTRSVVPFRTFGFDPYRSDPAGRLIVSRWGETFPYRKAPGSYRIVCFGGSTTENRVGELHYPAVLQALLRERLGRRDIEVINVGNSAYATPHSIVLLALDVISWEPDLVIVSHNINDLVAMYWPEFRPDYWNKYRHPVYSDPDYSRNVSWIDVAFRYSRFYSWASSRIRLARKAKIKMRRESYGDSPLPEAAAVFRRNLLTFISIARQRDVSVLVASQPLHPAEELFVRHYRYKRYNDIIVYPTHDEFVEHHRAFNGIAASAAVSANARFIDNAAALGGNHRYFTDSVHYTSEGITALAESYADFILEQNLIPAPAAAHE